MSRVKTTSINFRGRFEYLEATQRYWPELLPFLPTLNLGDAKSTGAVPQAWHELESLPEHRAAAKAILGWAQIHGVRDEWMLDAAVQTLVRTPSGSAPQRWWYFPSTMDVAAFKVAFGLWLPPVTQWGQPWEHFKRDVTRQFRQKLEEYRKSVILMWGASKRALEDHAAWTVLWQRGRSAEQIRLYYRGGRDTVTTHNILMSVHAFAASIGLTLRKGRFGPKRRT